MAKVRARPTLAAVLRAGENRENPLGVRMGESSMQTDGPTAQSSASDETSSLRRAERAFAVGDHRDLQALLPALRNAHDPAVRSRAEQLTRAVSADPALVAVLVGCMLALFAIIAHYVLGVAR